MGEMQGKIIDMQCRNMKYNLIFSGIPEFENENCYTTLRSFMNDHLNVDAYNIAFANVHRIGSRSDSKRRGKPRSIIARFIHNDDLLMVKNAARKLKGKPYWITEQYPQEIEDRRRRLYPIAKAERKKSSRVSLVRDRLYVNGQLVDVPNEPFTADSPTVQSTPIRARSQNDSSLSEGTRPPFKRFRVGSTPVCD
ncbi:hypothetical protein FSP39_025034 [Pinctada imbricata]|uniref:Uncharacterized protein n=1 Tax=Pinctada imbricata TaxID=66713 RepID=A0AA88YGC7_PINIB|nr:hypothetical protein FSP39_025034 [Pinctada imbricata]